MSDEHSTSEGLIVHKEISHKQPNIIAPETNMVILTWITFFVLLAVLYKLAWKPILQALDARELHIKSSVDEADKIKEELANIAIKQQQILSEAEETAKTIISDSRRAAIAAAAVIQEKTREEAKIVLDNAQREIKAQMEKSLADLRAEGANIAIILAGKIIEENLDNARNRNLIDQYIKEI